MESGTFGKVMGSTSDRKSLISLATGKVVRSSVRSVKLMGTFELAGSTTMVLIQFAIHLTANFGRESSSRLLATGSFIVARATERIVGSTRS
jgi:hypothetical protein